MLTFINIAKSTVLVSENVICAVGSEKPKKIRFNLL